MMTMRKRVYYRFVSGTSPREQVTAGLAKRTEVTGKGEVSRGRARGAGHAHIGVRVSGNGH